MKILKLKDVLGSKYGGFFTYEELYGKPDPRIKKFYNEQKLLNEGLILTHPIDKSISVLEKTGYDVVIVGKNESFKNRFFVQVNNHNVDIDKLWKITNNLGWYCSQIRNPFTNHDNNQVKYTRSNLTSHFEKYGEVMLLFEPKFDLEISTIDHKYLYHFTKEMYWSKIMKYGLVPKNQEKQANHPERIYLAFSAYSAEKFGHKIMSNPNNIQKHDNNQGIILKINVSNIMNYFKIYQDPNYYKEGCYTLNTIPFSAISIFKRM